MRTVCAALLFAAVAAQAAADWTIDTFAGQTALRDNGPAVEAQLSRPFGVAADGLGNIYIADWGNHRIRKVDSAGVITTVAGTGRPGFSGDGGPAVEAQVGWASGVAVDGSGNIYIADWGNLRIRKVDSAGVITTYAGTGERGFSGDGGPAAEARLDAPSGVAADGSGNVYFADQYNLRIRKVDSAGVITTVAGSTVSGFSGDGGPAVEAGLGSPYGVTTDGLGNVYIANRADHRIRKVDSAGVITTIAGSGLWGLSGDGGSATEARLAAPYSVAADTSGNVYIADSSNHRIRKVDSAGLITTLAGSGDNGDGGPAVEARLFGPLGVAADGSGNIYIADEDDSRIRKVNSAGVITTVAGTGQLGFSGDGGPAVEAQLYWPSGVAADGLGNVYIADQYNHRIRKVDSAGLITTLAGSGERGFSGDSGPAAEAQLNLPGGVALDTLGNVYIADTHNHRIRKVDSAGMITTVAGTGERGSSGDGGPAAEARLSFPNDVAPDTLGNVYIADSSNHRIRKVDSAGVITTVAGMAEDGFSGDSGPAVEARLSFLGGLATDGLGNIYIADRQNKRIRILKPSVGGDGEPPSGSQDNAPADHAAFNARFAGMMLEYLTAGATATMHLAEMNRFTESVEVAGVSSTYTGVYSYRRTGLNAGRLSLVYNDGDQCQVDLSFASMTAGSFASECTDDESATGSWRIVPSGDTAPSFGSAAVSNQTYDAGTAISPLTLPAATGGDGALTYGLTLSVPGLTFNASTRTLSGTPTTAGTYNMTYTVSAAGGGTATLGFAVTVNSASTPDDSDEYTSLSGWTVTAGRVQYWFFGSAGCVSINGISLNGVSYVAHTSKWQQRANADNAWTDVPGTANTGRVCAYSPTQSGQYRGVAEITVGGERGMYATSNILTVGASTGPSFGTAAVANRTYTAGTAIATLSLPAASGGDGTLTYSLSPSVPGLTFSSTSRTLSGTPSTSGAYSMTYSARDTAGGTATLSFTITVQATDLQPSFGTAAVANRTYTAGTAIATLSLPAASGGDGTLTYSLSPSVPGLTFSSTSRTLSGTPSTSGTYKMTYTARDADGDIATLRFTITIEAGGGGGGGSETRYEQGDTITTMPSGFWLPSTTSGASFQFTGGVATIQFQNGGYILQGVYRYTCASAAGCAVNNRVVQSGTIVETQP